MEAKRTSLEAAKVLMQNFGKDENDEIFQRLYHEYETTIQKQKELPIPSEYLTSNEDPML